TSRGVHVQRDAVGIEWERVLDGDACTLVEQLTFQNYTMERIRLPISLSFTAAFDDVYVIRRLLKPRPLRLEHPSWHRGALRVAAQCDDGRTRMTTVHCSPTPRMHRETTAHHHVVLEPRGEAVLRVTVLLEQIEQRSAARSTGGPPRAQNTTQPARNRH